MPKKQDTPPELTAEQLAKIESDRIKRAVIAAHTTGEHAGQGGGYVFDPAINGRKPETPNDKE